MSPVRIGVCVPSADEFRQLTCSTPRFILCSLPSPPGSFVQVSGRIYSLGGEQFATTGDWAESVNPSVDIVEWREEDPMPVARFQAAAAATPGRVYTMGGFGVEGGSAPIDSMVSIDTSSGQWRTETPMPTPRALLSAVYVPGGKIYAMGGRGAQDQFDPVVPTVESYDPVTGAVRTRLFATV